MSLFGKLHLLAPEIPDGLSIWRLQICGEGSSTYETLLLSNGELAHMRARAAKRPAAALPPPEPTVSAADSAAEHHRVQLLLEAEQLRVKGSEALLATERAALRATQSELDTLRGDSSALYVQLLSTQDELASAQKEVTVLMTECDVARVSADAATASIEALQNVIVRQTERLAAWPVPLAPWAEVGRALRRALGL